MINPKVSREISLLELFFADEVWWEESGRWISISKFYLQSGAYEFKPTSIPVTLMLPPGYGQQGKPDMGITEILLPKHLQMRRPGGPWREILDAGHGTLRSSGHQSQDQLLCLSLEGDDQEGHQWDILDSLRAIQQKLTRGTAHPHYFGTPLTFLPRRNGTESITTNFLDFRALKARVERELMARQSVWLGFRETPIGFARVWNPWFLRIEISRKDVFTLFTAGLRYTGPELQDSSLQSSRLPTRDYPFWVRVFRGSSSNKLFAPVWSGIGLERDLHSGTLWEAPVG